MPGYSLHSMPCCYWLLKGYEYRRNSLILFPLAAGHSVSRRAWPEAGTVSQHLDGLTWHRDSRSGGWLPAGKSDGVVLPSCGCPEMEERSLIAPVALGSLLGQPADEGVAERAVLLGSVLRCHPVAPQMWDTPGLCLSPLVASTILQFCASADWWPHYPGCMALSKP